MNVLVTVGSTTFDALSLAVLDEDLLAQLYKRGYRTMLLQHGKTKALPSNVDSSVDITMVTYLPDMTQAINTADLVISHAGAGTVLEVLKSDRKLIVVPNETLMDNHQVELAEKLASSGYCIMAKSNKEALIDALDEVHGQEKVSFIQSTHSNLQRIINDELGRL